MINKNKKVIEAYTGKITLTDGTEKDLITKMDSTTPIFKANIEYYGQETTCRDYTKGEYEYETNADGSVKMDGIYAVKKEGRKNNLKSIDFGIVERAKQSLALDKTIKNVKLILTNGNTLIDAKIDENGKLQDTNDAVFLPGSNGKNAQLKLEIDNEIIDGAELRIEYGLEVENISELEYLNEEFYKYGAGHGMKDEELVQLSAKNVIDYLDNGISTDSGEYLAYLISATDKDQLIPEGFLDDTLKDTLSQRAKILNIPTLEKQLSPKEGENKYDIATNEVDVTNNAEIIEIEKTGGSTIVATPGNYEPGSSQHEVDDSASAGVVVLPPTGENLNYVPVILLAISTLSLLGVGIILIKKYIKKNNA